MVIIKKLLFAPLFLLCWGLFLQKLNPFLSNPYLIFSLNLEALYQSITLLGLMILTGYFWGVFATLANDWKIIAPALLCASILPLALITQPISFVLGGGLLLWLIFTFAILHSSLATYITFQPNVLITPTVKQTASVILVLASIAFYLGVRSISSHGFTIPDSLLDISLQFTKLETATSQEPTLQQFQMTPEQLQMLKQNPELLKQYGLDPKILDNLDTTNPQAATKNLLRDTVKSQFQNMIAPYQQYIPIILALLFYLSLQFMLAFLNLLPPILIWLLFWILEKTGYIRFEVEQRPVRKLVV